MFLSKRGYKTLGTKVPLQCPILASLVPTPGQTQILARRRDMITNLQPKLRGSHPNPNINICTVCSVDF